ALDRNADADDEGTRLARQLSRACARGHRTIGRQADTNMARRSDAVIVVVGGPRPPTQFSTIEDSEANVIIRNVALGDLASGVSKASVSHRGIKAFGLKGGR